MPEDRSDRVRPIVDLVGGARPNFMKLASVWRAMAAQGLVQSRIVHTGQHYDELMSGVFFDQLCLPAPFAHLGVGSGSHGVQTGQMLERYEAHLLASRPAATVVFGDVNSTVAAALAASKLNVPVVHVEAGLRSHDRSMPEEMNRIVTDHVSDLLLVTEPDAVEQLRGEGIDAARIELVGNTMIDTLQRFLPDVRERGRCRQLELTPDAYAILTLHRPANVDDEIVLRRLLACAGELAADVPIVFPVHPRTRRRIEQLGLRSDELGGVRLVAPEGYLESLSLMADARVVFTDSGGMQQEAAALGTPCIVLRDVTEHRATQDSGACRVVGTDPAVIRGAWDDVRRGRWAAPAPTALWDGGAGERVARAVARLLRLDDAVRVG